MIDMSVERAATFATAADYQMWHGLAIIAVALWQRSASTALLALALWAFFGGIILFCGALYLISAADVSGVRIVAPIGGTLLLAGWLLTLAGAIARAR